MAGVVYFATQDFVRESLDIGDFGGFVAALLAIAAIVGLSLLGLP